MFVPFKILLKEELLYILERRLSLQALSISATGYVQVFNALKNHAYIFVVSKW